MPLSSLVARQNGFDLSRTVKNSIQGNEPNNGDTRIFRRHSPTSIFTENGVGVLMAHFKPNSSRKIDERHLEK
jgi:hypothetical protein